MQTTLGEILENALRPLPENPAEAGRRWREFMDEHDRSIVDAMIKQGTMKITAIRFIRGKTGLGLTYAKALYEAREKWIAPVSNPYGF